MDDVYIKQKNNILDKLHYKISFSTNLSNYLINQNDINSLLWHDELSVNFLANTSITLKQDNEKRFTNLNRQKKDSKLNSSKYFNIKQGKCVECIDGHYLLNLGSPIWSISFSTCIYTPICVYILAIGCNPIHTQLSERTHTHVGNGIIQLWTIPHTNSHPTHTLNIIHNGVICKCIEWVKNSQDSQNSRVGLLCAVLGDGNVCIYSVPIYPFLDTNQETINLELPPVWTYKGINKIISASPSFQKYDETIYLATSSTTGEILIFDLLKKDPPIVFIITEKEILGICWLKMNKSNYIACYTSNGLIIFWDIQSPISGHLFTIKLYNQAINDLCVCTHTGYLFASHENGIFYNINNRQTSLIPHSFNFQTKKTVDCICWGCDFFKNIALYTYDNGSLLLNQFEFLSNKRKINNSVKFVWTLSREPTVEDFESYDKSDSDSVIDTSDTKSILNKVKEIYTQKIDKERHIIKKTNISIKSYFVENAPIITKQPLNSFSLNKVKFSEEVINNKIKRAFVAYGGSLGLLHIFDPSTVYTNIYLF